MVFGKRTSSTWASGSSLALPPSAVTTMVSVWLFRSAARRSV